MNSLPDDLIIEGDVLAHNNEKLHLQLLEMHKRGQIRGNLQYGQS